MTEFKNKSKKDLFKTLNEKKDALQDFRFGGAGSKSKNVKEGKNIRKDIARILTEINSQVRADANKIDTK